MREWEWEGMGIKILLREGMGMLVYYGNGNTVMEMRGNGIKKVIPAHL